MFKHTTFHSFVSPSWHFVKQFRARGQLRSPIHTDFLIFGLVVPKSPDVTPLNKNNLKVTQQEILKLYNIKPQRRPHTYLNKTKIHNVHQIILNLS